MVYEIRRLAAATVDTIPVVHVQKDLRGIKRAKERGNLGQKARGSKHRGH